VEVLRKTRLPHDQPLQLGNWEEFIYKLNNPKTEVRIGLIGKYVELKDAYKSIQESFVHAGASNQCRVLVKTIHSESITEENVIEKLMDLDGLLVAPGFGQRGIDGKIISIKYARENKVPFLGICLGMQCAVVEFARNVLGYRDAHSTEMDPRTTHPVIDLMEHQKGISEMGHTMRLGSYPCRLTAGTKVAEIYKEKEISERHRHRFEFNNQYLGEYEDNGMVAAGINPNENLVEIVELRDHPWFVGVQFHPEYKSTVDAPHPLFVGFIAAAVKHRKR
jgi:CTP synthase